MKEKKNKNTETCVGIFKPLHANIEPVYLRNSCLVKEMCVQKFYLSTENDQYSVGSYARYLNFPTN